MGGIVMGGKPDPRNSEKASGSNSNNNDVYDSHLVISGGCKND
jgi:hypothetical protein